MSQLPEAWQGIDARLHENGSWAVTSNPVLLAVSLMLAISAAVNL